MPLNEQSGGASAEAQAAAGMRELLRSPHARLAIGVMLMEFAAGITVYFSAVVVPSVVAELSAQRQYPLLLSAGAVGMFTALPLARPLLRRFGSAPMFTAGLLISVVGTALSAAAGSAWMFAVGRLLASFGGSLLGVFGISAVIATIPLRFRKRLLSLTSAMWIVPGLFGPALAVASLHLVGWRWALLFPLPLALLARALVARAAVGAAVTPAATPDTGQPDATPSAGEQRRDAKRRTRFRRIGQALLPIGMGVFTFGSSSGAWAFAGLLLAVVGARQLLPAGTLTAKPGPQRYLALLAVIAFGYFGADSLLTAALTRADGIAIGWAGAGLGAAGAAWALAALVQPNLANRLGETTTLRCGVALLAAAVTAVSLTQLTASITGPLFLGLWAMSGAGMGLLYPVTYVRATTVPSDTAGSDTASSDTPRSDGASPDAAALATAVILAEGLGQSVGIAVGGGVVAVVQSVGSTEAFGLHVAIAGYAAVLVLTALFTTAGGRRRTPLRAAGA